MKLVFETILYIVGDIGILCLACFLYGKLLVEFLPKTALHLKYTARLGDRGILRYTMSEGHAVVYQPGVGCHRAISQYILIHTREQNQKCIKCQVTGNYRRIAYDVAVFNQKDKLIRIIGINENVENSRWTKAYLLPAETNYVSVIVRKVNDEQVCKDTVFAPGTTGEVVSVAVTLSATVLLVLLMRFFIQNICVVLHATKLAPYISTQITILIGVLFGLFMSFLLIVCNRKAIRKEVNQ